MILLLRDLHMFINILAECSTTIDCPPYKLGDRDYSIPELMNLFSIYIRSKTKEVFIRDPLGIPEVLLGNTGIILTDDGISIHDYHDYRLPDDSELIIGGEIMSYFTGEDFLKIEKEVNDGHRFELDFAWDLLADLDF